VAAGADAQITELAVDDHACLTFGEEEELLDLTAAFVRDGLRRTAATWSAASVSTRPSGAWRPCADRRGSA
jgi:hypothetical protein